jgi:hypothetical protein
MILMPKELAAAMPALYSQENLGEDAIVHAHYFSPLTGWDWFATEYNPETEECFGLVFGFEEELGYFSLAELAGINAGKGFAYIERDLYWTPKPLKACRRAVAS